MCMRAALPTPGCAPCSGRARSTSTPPRPAPAPHAGPDSSQAPGPNFEHLACYRSRGNPVLFAADGSGVVRIFDLRAGAAAGSTQHLKSRLSGEQRAGRAGGVCVLCV